jgi:hypothetical protein
MQRYATLQKHTISSFWECSECDCHLFRDLLWRIKYDIRFPLAENDDRDVAVRRVSAVPIYMNVFTVLGVAQKVFLCSPGTQYFSGSYEEKCV